LVGSVFFGDSSMGVIDSGWTSAIRACFLCFAIAVINIIVPIHPVVVDKTHNNNIIHIILFRIDLLGWG
jgi:hypothetical protein